MKRTSLFLPEHYVQKSTAFCKLTGLTFSELVRRALDAYLEAEAPKILQTGKSLKRRAQ